ncbi:protein singed wings 2 [Arctopsyche grandis]|uniref:protein singed wings 2 n=1 Tax=Arctopsyche grandis TaxID=121162 RepID=UPI00406D8A0D
MYSELRKTLFRCFFLISMSTFGVFVFGTDPEEDQQMIIECTQYPSSHFFNTFDRNNVEYQYAKCFYEDDDGQNLTCVDGIETRWMNTIHHSVRVLTIAGWPDECLSPSMIFHHFPYVETLSVVNSSFVAFSDDFPYKAFFLKRLYLNRLTNLTLRTNLLSNLAALEDLDLQENLFTTIHPDFISSSSTLKSVFLHNNRWNCSDTRLQWLAYLNTSSQLLAKSRIVDYDKLTCQGNMYPGKPIHTVMSILKILHDECPKECSCTLSNLVNNAKVPGGGLLPLATADCRHRGLLTIPTNLPTMTTILLLQGNNISELHPLAQNSAYRKIVDVYLDDNVLNSVRPLEGSDWMLNFRILSLRGNNLSHLPIYFFDSALRNNNNAIRIFLGNNPWKCNCHFTPKYQEFLMRHNLIIGDIKDIRCREKNQSEISKALISTLSRTTICRKIEEKLNVIDMVNIFLATSIILILGKFCYDYYYFKKTGRLPWISSKIP